MVDITLPRPRPISAPKRVLTAVMLFAVALVLFTILQAVNLSLSKVETCKTERGAFSLGFSVGFDVKRRDCRSQQSDPMPLGILGSPF